MYSKELLLIGEWLNCKWTVGLDSSHFSNGERRGGSLLWLPRKAKLGSRDLSVHKPFEMGTGVRRRIEWNSVENLAGLHLLFFYWSMLFLSILIYHLTEFWFLNHFLFIVFICVVLLSLNRIFWNVPVIVDIFIV